MPICKDCKKSVSWRQTKGKYHLADHDCVRVEKVIDEQKLALVSGVCFTNENLEDGYLEYLLNRGRTDKFVFNK